MDNLLGRVHRAPPIGESETARILSIPITPRLTNEQREQISRDNVQAGPFEGHCTCHTCEGRPFRLLEKQAEGLHAFLQVGGGFFNVEVGGGKTGLCMLIASHFARANPEAKILVLIPSSVAEQFWLRDLPWARKHLVLSVPFYGLAGRSRRTRRALAASGRPGAYVMPYSQLSTEDTLEQFDLIKPGLVISDEAHELCGDLQASAKNKRFWTYVRRNTPRMVGMSGTLTVRTPMEYHRLMKACLPETCPLPKPKVEAIHWAQAVRSREDPPGPEELARLSPLVKWATLNFPEKDFPFTAEGVRRAFKARLHSTPGFVTSGSKALGTTLEIANLPADEPDSKLLGMIDDVRQYWQHPCGDVLTYGIELHNAQRELSAGFYYERHWPDHPLTEQAVRHWEAGQAYFSELRNFFRSTLVPREGLDTPKVVGLWHAKHGAIEGWQQLYDLWRAWKDLEREDLPDRLSVPVWVDDYKIHHVVSWAKKVKVGGILWCHHRAVMERLAKALAEAGLPVLLKGGGATWAHNDGSEQFFCVASISAHWQGKNLQHHQHQLVVQWPRSATVVEQLLGRTHRTGQKAERLIVHTTHTIDFDHEQMAATLQDAIYDAETMAEGQRKLLIANWNPLPRQYPPEFLRAKGYRV